MTFEHSNAPDLIDAPDLTFEASSGRATWDERGNSIWEWQTAPGIYSRHISAQQLEALEARHLDLIDGDQANTEFTLWSRNSPARTTKRKQANEIVLPQRRSRADKGSGFDLFLRKLGLPA